MAEYVGPVVTTDSVVVRLGVDGLEVLLHRRPRDPFAGYPALPGVYVALGETIASATDRCVLAKGGVDISAAGFRRTMEVYDELERDPRGHALSVVTLTVLPPHSAGEPAGKDAWWEPVPLSATMTRDVAFDHADIVADARAWLLERLWSDAGVFRALLGTSKLSTSNLRSAASALGYDEPSASNFRRRIENCEFFVRSEDMDSDPGQRGRPSRLWRWAPPPD